MGVASSGWSSHVPYPSLELPLAPHGLGAWLQGHGVNTIPAACRSGLRSGFLLSSTGTSFLSIVLLIPACLLCGPGEARAAETARDPFLLSSFYSPAGSALPSGTYSGPLLDGIWLCPPRLEILGVNSGNNYNRRLSFHRSSWGSSVC